MKSIVTYYAVKDFLLCLALTQPRILLMCVMVPVFSKQLLPGRLRGALVVALGLLVVPRLWPGAVGAAHDLAATQILLLMFKEAFIGLVLGFFVAIPFWAVEAVGTLIDYQRGASMGAILNPTMGADSTPIAILFQLAYAVFFFSSGGVSLMLSMLYDSFRVWDPWLWFPTLHRDAIPLLLAQLDRLMRLMVLFSAPVVIIMLLSELGLALASRFTPQLQVFFLAMPIKTGLALFVLVLYVGTLFEHAGTETRRIADTIPFLTHIWRVR
jgi:type III secretion protein T